MVTNPAPVAESVRLDGESLCGLPDHWQSKPLKQLGHLTDGDWILRENYSESGVRLLQIGDVGFARFEDKSSRYIAEQTAVELIETCKI